MSLRTDVHAAFDKVAPSTFGLSERVVRSVIEGRPQRQARTRSSPRLRGVMSLVALVLLLVMAVGVLAGVRLYRDFSSSAARRDLCWSGGRTL